MAKTKAIVAQLVKDSGGRPFDLDTLENASRGKFQSDGGQTSVSANSHGYPGVIGLFAGQASIISYLQQSDEMFIPSIALGELHYGAWKSGRVQQNLERIEEFVADVTIIDCDAATAR